MKGDDDVHAIDLFRQLLDALEDTLMAQMNTVVTADRDDRISVRNMSTTPVGIGMLMKPGWGGPNPLPLRLPYD
jgi:hypothetical protein